METNVENRLQASRSKGGTTRSLMYGVRGQCVGARGLVVRMGKGDGAQ